MILLSKNKNKKTNQTKKKLVYRKKKKKIFKKKKMKNNKIFIDITLNSSQFQLNCKFGTNFLFL